MTDLFLQQVELGGVDFDLLCHGATPYYSFNLANLMTPDVRTEDHIETKIIEKLEDTLTALQIGSGRKIAKFYIGMTFVPRRKGSKNFDPLNNNTWKKNGISSRWVDHKKTDYGRDGMVVLCAITRDTVPPSDGKHQEDFTLDMEQRLIRHYRNDPRLVHIQNPGQRASRYPVYAIYMAFAYAEEDEETEEEDEDTEVED